MDFSRLIPAQAVADIRDDLSRAGRATYTTDDDVTLLLNIREWHRAAGNNSSHVEHGLCIRLDPDPGRTLGDIRRSVHWRHAVVLAVHGGKPSLRPTFVEGVDPADLPVVLGRLVDTFRADRARRNAMAQLRAGTLVNLARVTERWVQGGRDIGVPNEADASRSRIIRVAYLSGVLTEDEIRETAQVPSHANPFYDLAPWGSQPMRLLVDPQQFGLRHGIKPATVRSYRSRGLMPEPEVQLGDTPGWYLDTCESWIRPGQGARTDLILDPGLARDLGMDTDPYDVIRVAEDNTDYEPDAVGCLAVQEDGQCIALVADLDEAAALISERVGFHVRLTPAANYFSGERWTVA